MNNQLFLNMQGSKNFSWIPAFFIQLLIINVHILSCSSIPNNEATASSEEISITDTLLINISGEDRIIGNYPYSKDSVLIVRSESIIYIYNYFLNEKVVSYSIDSIKNALPGFKGVSGEVAYHEGNLFIIPLYGEPGIFRLSKNYEYQKVLDAEILELNFPGQITFRAYSPIHFTKNRLIAIISSTDTRMDQVSGRKNFYNRPLIFSFNPADNSSNLFHTPIIQELITNDYYKDFPSFTINKDNNIIISPQIDDSIYVVGESNIKSKHAQSDYIKYFNPIASDPTPQEVLKYNMGEPKYSQIYFDDINNFYYRKTKLRVPEDSLNALPFPMGDWSLIVLDSSFQKIDELYFDSIIYDPEIIISPNGLLVHLKKSNKYILYNNDQ